MPPPNGRSEDQKAVADELRKQAKKEFLHELSRQLHKYTISLILDGKFYGTGTLVEIDGVKGILTAEHVIHNPEGKRFDNSESSRQILAGTRQHAERPPYLLYALYAQRMTTSANPTFVRSLRPR